MERLPKGMYIKYNENTLDSVRKLFGLDKPGAMENAIDILEEWVKKQEHFTTKKFERIYLETTIIVSKGSIERAKSKLDRACTLRTLMPHLFQLHNFRILVSENIEGVILPKMTKDNIRVIIMKMNDDFDILSLSRAFTFAGEYLRRYDYAATNCFVIDYQKTNLLKMIQYLTMNIHTMQQLVTYLMECCGFRFRTFYAISSSKFIEAIAVIFKQVVTAKLRDRIQILKDNQSLREVFGTEILPREYGGQEKSILELQEQMLDELTSEMYTQYMKEINSARTDETRRHSAKFNEEYLGMPGSFRKLDLD